MPTYFIVNKDEYEFDDGFCLGGGTISSLTEERINHHCEDGWVDSEDRAIYDDCAKANFTRKRWAEIIDELKAGELKPCVRIGWFEESNKVEGVIRNFFSELNKIGYEIRDEYVASLCAHITEKKEK